ncbi:hypothetical protein B2J86_11835 [Acidovorax sp. SRB_14]|nr:hypothetical protein [Acidovorax sp. SRB_14]
MLIADLALTGSGQWSDVMGFSVRRLLLLLLASYTTVMWAAFVFWAPRALAGVLGMALFLLTWSVGFPLLYDVPLTNALNDSQLFLGLLFAPAFAQMIVRTGCWPSALRLIERSIWLLALLHIAIYWVEKVSDSGAAVLVLAMRSVLEPSRADVETNFMIGHIPDGFRVFWGSSIFLLIGLYLAVRNFAQRRLFVSVVILLTISYAIQLTLTRAMVLAIPLFLVLTWLFDRLLTRLRMGTVLYLFVGIALLALTLPTMLLADPTLLAAVGLGREVSDDIRYEQVMALTDAIMNKPWFGSGMGAYVDLIRSEESPWMYELSMLALYMKVGLVGAAWLVVVFMLYGRVEQVNTHSHQPLPASIRRAFSRIGALLFCIVFASNTNPYLFSMLGWGLLMFTYVEFCVTKHRWQVAGAPA